MRCAISIVLDRETVTISAWLGLANNLTRGEHFVGFFHLSTKGKFVGFSSICRQKSTKNFFGSFNDFLAYIHY